MKLMIGTRKRGRMIFVGHRVVLDVVSTNFLLKKSDRVQFKQIRNIVKLHTIEITRALLTKF